MVEKLVRIIPHQLLMKNLHVKKALVSRTLLKGNQRSEGAQVLSMRFMAAEKEEIDVLSFLNLWQLHFRFVMGALVPCVVPDQLALA